MRTYRWGRFQGWASVILGLCFLLIGPFSGVRLAVRLAIYVVGFFQIGLGVGLLGKKRYGLMLLYILLLLLVGEMATQTMHVEAYVLIGGWWFAPAIFYYPKRWKEFTR